MKKRILIHSMAILCVSLLISLLLFNYDELKTRREITDTRMRNIAISLSKESDDKQLISDIKRAETYEEDLRFTLIDETGKVLFDTGADAEKMENHIDRPEIIKALKNHVGESSRYSETLGAEYRYFTYMTQGSRLLRVSTRLETGLSAIRSSIPNIIFIMFIAGLISFVLLSGTLKKTFSRLEELVKNLRREVLYEGGKENMEVDDELLPIVEIVDRQKQDISFYVKSLKDRMKTVDDILKNMNEGIIILDRDFNVVALNSSARRLLTLTKGFDYVGRKIQELRRDLTFISEKGQQLDGKSVEMNVDGRVLKLIISPIESSENEFIGRMVLVIDETKTMALERMRREFSANISHELKTPLTSINGYAEMIEQGIAKGDDVKRFAGIIVDQGRRLLELIDDIMKLSKLDETGFMLEKELVNASDILARVEPYIREKAKNAGVELIFEVESGLKIWAVPSMLEELLSNLLSNGIKYNIQGGKLWLRMKETDRDVLIEVQDTGIGISPIDQARIFERFYVVDSSRSKGTGLGLAIVKHIVSLHGGKIELTSGLGIGTTFTVSLEKYPGNLNN